MRVLYVGDIMGEFGRWVVEKELPSIKSKYRPDIVLAQAENVTHGRGLKIDHYKQLKSIGIDGFMSGNHILAVPEAATLVADKNHPVTRPANYPEGAPGQKYKIIPTKDGDVALITLLGQIVGKDADEPTINPLQVVDELLGLDDIKRAPIKIVNFHGDYSSEKVVIGQYLDGEVSAVVGDHWHVPSADARVLPGGTAHISDVGMVGARNSSLGVKTDVIVERWRRQKPSRNELEEVGEYQFCGLIVEIDPSTSKAVSVEQILTYGTRT